MGIYFLIVLTLLIGMDRYLKLLKFYANKAKMTYRCDPNVPNDLNDPNDPNDLNAKNYPNDPNDPNDLNDPNDPNDLINPNVPNDQNDWMTESFADNSPYEIFQ